MPLPGDNLLPGFLPGDDLPPPNIDADIIAELFDLEGGILMLWEQAGRCTCWTTDTKQPQWGHDLCGGLGVVYGELTFPDGGLTFDPRGEGITLREPLQIKALYRAQSRWRNRHSMGEFQHGEAQLTTPVSVRPQYVDARVRDRFTVLDSPTDQLTGRVFYPAAKAVPFIIGGEVCAWRVQLQGMEQADRVRPQP